MSVYSIYFSPTGGTKKITDILPCRLLAAVCPKLLQHALNHSQGSTHWPSLSLSTATVPTKTHCSNFQISFQNVAFYRLQLSLPLPNIPSCISFLPQLPGSRPYKKYGTFPFLPLVNNRCTGCKKCALPCRRNICRLSK